MGRDLNLSAVERIILTNQYRIMEMLTKDPSEQQHYREAQTILENGYEYFYENLHPDIYDGQNVFTEEQGRTVVDILDMFDMLGYSYDQLSNKSDIEEWKVRFSGFCGNEESEYMGFASFFCKSGGGRFQSVVQRMKGDGFNSHLPLLDAYRRMLSVYGPIKAKLHGRNRLTEQEIISVISEFTHPDSR